MTAEPSETKHLAAPVDAEIKAMKAIGDALEALPDSEARSRVVAWAASRFSTNLSASAMSPVRNPPSYSVPTPHGERGKEIPGIARIADNGNLELTVRDLKARSTIDASIRLAHIAIFANEQLTGSTSLSSRKVLVPILKSWRCYDGNTRPAMAKQKGILRSGDNLSLDVIARKDAEKYITEVLDDAVVGSWNPNAKRSKRSSATKTAAA
jgi:hypothetical protein